MYSGNKMRRIFFKSKLHRATITDANLNYEGSLTIDEDLLKAAGILPFEKVDVVNINNGERFTTYAILGEKGSGDMCLNGAAARKGQVGDRIIVITYAHFSDEELKAHKPLSVLLDEENKIVSVTESEIAYRD